MLDFMVIPLERCGAEGAQEGPLLGMARPLVPPQLVLPREPPAAGLTYEWTVAAMAPQMCPHGGRLRELARAQRLGAEVGSADFPPANAGIERRIEAVPAVAFARLRVWARCRLRH